MQLAFRTVCAVVLGLEHDSFMPRIAIADYTCRGCDVPIGEKHDTRGSPLGFQGPLPSNLIEYR